MLNALGATEKAIDCDDLRDRVARCDLLAPSIDYLVTKKMQHLGYNAQLLRLSYRDAGMAQAVCELLDAQYHGIMPHIEQGVREFLASNAATLDPPTQDIDEEYTLHGLVVSNMKGFHAMYAQRDALSAATQRSALEEKELEMCHAQIE